MVNSQEMLKDEKWEPEEIIFLNTYSKLVLLQQIDISYAFTVLDPFNNTGYMTNYMFHSSREFHSLDGDHDKVFVSTGSDHCLYFQHLGMPLPSPTRCPENKTIAVKPIENVLQRIDNNNNNGQYLTQEILIPMRIDTISSQQICNSSLNVK